MSDEFQDKLLFKLGESTNAIKELAKHVKTQNHRIDKLETTEQKHSKRWSQLYVIGAAIALIWGIVGPLIVFKLQQIV